MTIYTIGHSTRTIDEFTHILKTYGIQLLVDVRTIPKSRHNPQFNEDSLRDTLHKNHIAYIHMKGLGGLRHTTKESINTAWRNLSFRGYADYMQTAEFKKNLEELIKVAQDYQTVIMCAEAVPWRCHRSLIGDALLVHHIKVIDIFNEHTSKPHTLTPWAKISDSTVSYPSQ